MARRHRLAATLLVAIGAAGCDRPGGEAALAPPPAPAVVPGADALRAPPSCATFPPAEIAAALGVAELGVPEADIRGRVTLCAYPAERDPARVTLRFETGADAATMAGQRADLERAGQPVSEVRSLGDRAYATSSGPARTLSVLTGDVLFSIGSSDPPARQKALAARILERLRR